MNIYYNKILFIWLTYYSYLNWLFMRTQTWLVHNIMGGKNYKICRNYNNDILHIKPPLKYKFIPYCFFLKQYCMKILLHCSLAWKCISYFVLRYKTIKKINV